MKVWLRRDGQVPAHDYTEGYSERITVLQEGEIAR